MKIHGVTIDPPEEKVIVVPRNDKKFVFRAKAVLDFTAFEQICPKPKPRTQMAPGGEKKELFDEPKYLKEVNKWAERRTAWTILTSLSATEGLEWDTVVMSDPDTWMNYEEELRNNFSEIESVMIASTALDACSLTSAHIDEATKSFLALTEGEQKELCSQSSEPSSTQSTDPAKD